jgi:hypothetical protein
MFVENIYLVAGTPDMKASALETFTLVVCSCVLTHIAYSLVKSAGN